MAAVNPYDQASRYLVRLDAAGMLAWLLGLPPKAFAFVGWLDTRSLPWPGEADRTCDTVAHLRDLGRGGLPWAVVVEFQVSPDATMFGRLLRYLGDLWTSVKASEERGDRFEVSAIVVNLTGQWDCGRDMHWPQARLRTALLEPDRNLASMSAALVLDGVESGNVTRAVLAWIPLMQGGGEDGIIQRWRGLVEPMEEKWRADLGGLALVYAEAAPCTDEWKKALEGWNVIQSKQVAEWQAQAEVRATTNAVVAVLEERFGSLSEELPQAIRESTNLDALRRWVRLAVKTASLDDFRRDAGL
jgi:hypothetical protein